MNSAKLYALDFDGVICDSAVETAHTGWKAAQKIWTDMTGAVPMALVEDFRLVRPIIETGYEAILAMRLLYQGASVASIYSDYAELTAALMRQAAITVEQLKHLFGETRDIWIETDLTDWVQMNPLFAGVAKKLQNLPAENVYIITTKQERFVKQILDANAIHIDGKRIFGLDRNLSKQEVLKLLLASHPQQAIQFVEDRLPTLVKVSEQAALAEVALIFALWGYNTEQDKADAVRHGFTVQSLDNFLI